MPKRLLMLLGVAILLIAATVLIVTKDKPFQSVPKKDAEPVQESLLMEIPIAQKGIDWDNDGKQEKLAIVMTQGELRNEENPGPFQGEFNVGQFAAILSDAGGTELQRFDMTPSFQGNMQFRNGAFELIFDDYNDDSYPDFTIGQYGSSNNYIYCLFTIKQGGISLIAQEMFSATSEYSIPLSKSSPNSFLNRYYDNSRGGLIEAAYEWDGKSFKKTGEIAVEDKEAQQDPIELQLTVTPNDYGFNLSHNDSYYINFDEIIYMENKLVMPFTQRNGAEDSTDLRRVVELFDVESRQSVLSEVITDATVTNSYGVSSALQIFGLLNDNQIVYSNVANEAGEQTYRIDTLDLRTGKEDTILAGVPTALREQEFLARNWFSPTTNRLVFNKYQEGSMEVIDLMGRTVKTFHNQYKHDWPFFMTIPSPDGALFWYQDSVNREFRLFDLEEKVLATIPYPAGMFDYGPWIWSEDSAFTAFYYTFDEDRKHVIDSTEIDNIAPQGIRIINREGKEIANVKSNPKKDEYVDIAGWLPERNSVLLRYFHLNREPGRNENFPILDSTYKLYDIGKRTFSELKSVKEAAELHEPRLITSVIPPLNNLIIDLNAKRIWEAPDFVYPIVSPSGVLYIIRNDEEKEQAEIARFDKSDNAWHKSTLPYNFYSPTFVGENWLSSGAIAYVDLRKLYPD